MPYYLVEFSYTKEAVAALGLMLVYRPQEPQGILPNCHGCDLLAFRPSSVHRSDNAAVAFIHLCTIRTTRRDVVVAPGRVPRISGLVS